MQKSTMNSFFKSIKNHTFSVVFWDGEVKNYGEGNPTLKVIFRKPLPVSFDFTDPMLAFGEAYMYDFIDFEGSFDEIMMVAEENKKLFSMKGYKLLKSTLKKISRVNIKEKQKENIQHHYDLGNDFFSLWLDETLSYSCAYFKNPTDSLYEAQMNKIDLVLKKLQLKPGEKLLDIGCGWGWLIIRAAQNYGSVPESFNIIKHRQYQNFYTYRFYIKTLLEII